MWKFGIIMYMLVIAFGIVGCNSRSLRDIAEEKHREVILTLNERAIFDGAWGVEVDSVKVVVDTPRLVIIQYLLNGERQEEIYVWDGKLNGFIYSKWDSGNRVESYKKLAINGNINKGKVGITNEELYKSAMSYCKKYGTRILY